MATVDESLSSTIESDDELLNVEPARFSFRSYIPRSESKVDIIGGCCTIVFLILALFWLLIIFPIQIIMIGSRNIAHCPIQTKIPIFLIVTGTMPIISSLLCVGIVSIKLADIFNLLGKCLTYIAFLIQIFWLIWVIFGIAWTVNVKMDLVQHTNTSSPTYCDENTFNKCFATLGMHGALSIIFTFIYGFFCYCNRH